MPASERLWTPPVFKTLKSAPLPFYIADSSRLDKRVLEIKKVGLKGITQPGQLIDLNQRIDGKAILNNLPGGSTEEDVVGVLKLALLTECATESFSDAIVKVAKKHEANWLEEFNVKVWKPDELTHFEPYKQILLAIGFSEAELDSEIAETREKEFDLIEGSDPVQVTSYGMKQEYLAQGWHGLARGIVKGTNKEIAREIGRVEGRESMHKVWYRDLNSTLISLNPSLIQNVAAEIPGFNMPGAQLVPELQAKARRWRELFESNPERTKSDLMLLTRDSIGGMQNAGQLIVEIIDQQKVNLGPLKHQIIKPLAKVSAGLVQRLLAEGLMESAGYGQIYKDQDKGIPGRIWAAGRTMVAHKIDEYIGVLASAA